MRIIELDASGCTTPLDFLDAARCAIGAPESRGLDVDAIVDSIIRNDVHSVQPPYTIRVVGTVKLDPKIKMEIETLAKALKDTRIWRANHRYEAIDVAIEIAP
jgi:hypothetical protein